LNLQTERRRGERKGSLNEKSTRRNRRSSGEEQASERGLERKWRKKKNCFANKGRTKKSVDPKARESCRQHEYLKLESEAKYTEETQEE